ncbi:MAG TPA: hypothetical protein PKX92_13055 [Edaphocola sp.]|nr:hypothetical protein [Edaphocola sp.]
MRNCIYGVDKNPLAVELCKIALWLEAYNPGEPLNFLDHHIKCGDAIVGLAHRSELENGIANEAFKTLPGDDKDIAKTWRDKNIKERKERASNALQLKAEFEKSTENSVEEAMAEYKTFSQLPETTPEEIERKAKAYKKFIDGKGFTFLKAMADTQVAQFFIPKTDANKDYLMTDADYRLILSGYKGWQLPQTAQAKVVALEQRFFHWFIEFPEVFSEGGFDCVLGNPPFLGGQKLSGTLGDGFLESIKHQFAPIGAVDLVTYFFRRIFTIIKPKGFQSLISTNTIAQGRAREDGLDVIVQQGGSINHAVKSTKWLGVAAVEVSLLTITKQVWKGKFYLDNMEVGSITTLLDASGFNKNPYTLFSNVSKCFQGHNVLGDGFFISKSQYLEMIEGYELNKSVIFPIINANELLNSPSPDNFKRFVIYFNEMTFEEASKFTKPFLHIQENVKPDRESKDVRKYPRMVKEWWKFWMNKRDFSLALQKSRSVLYSAIVSKTHAFQYLPSNVFSSHANVGIPDASWQEFSCLQSSFHEAWSWKYASTMKGDRRYLPSDCFETFPFPKNNNPLENDKLEELGCVYHEHRRQIMLGMQLGLTKTYNLFHSHAITAQSINEKDKQVAALQKHLDPATGGAPNTISFKEAIQGILKLRELHVQMDEAVLDAYGWRFDSAQRPDIELRHDFYEVDYLPENDRIRFTIHPDARKEVLKRLLELNHKIHEEEVKAGLWEKKGKKGRKSYEALNETSIFEEPDENLGGLFKQK